MSNVCVALGADREGGCGGGGGWGVRVGVRVLVDVGPEYR